MALLRLVPAVLSTPVAALKVQEEILEAIKAVARSIVEEAWEYPCWRHLVTLVVGHEVSFDTVDYTPRNVPTSPSSLCLHGLKSQPA
ncbi:hypothetical protein FRB90_008918 [Tulasnella sp. 427]|nr:hypothetical protein FRB90_008918 [Tulasnella sp. 427]